MTNRTALLLLAAATLAAPAHAQTFVAATASGAIDGAVIAPADCAQSFTVGVPAACTRAGAADNYFVSFARVDPGGALRGLAFVGGSATAAEDTVGSAGASWTERVLFTPYPEPIFGFLAIEMRGSQGTEFAGDGSAIGASTATFMQMGIYRDGLWDVPEALDEVVLVRGLQDYGSFQAHTLGQQETVRGVTGAFTSAVVGAGDTVFPFTMMFEIDPGTGFYDWNWRFAANALMAPGAAGFAFADYRSTFAIRSVGFLDTAGRDITRLLDVQFASGATYRLSTVPEPAGWVMLIAGLGLMSLAVRRRRAWAPVRPGQ